MMKFFEGRRPGGDDHRAIVKEFRRLSAGDPLPRTGACSYFYEHVAYAGQTIPLTAGAGYALFHFESDDVMQELLAGVPTVHAETEDARVFISIVFKTGEILNRIPITFDRTHRASARILSSFAAGRKIELNLVNMICGMMVKERSITLPVPAPVIAEIKKAAG